MVWDLFGSREPGPESPSVTAILDKFNAEQAALGHNGFSP